MEHETPASNRATACPNGFGDPDEVREVQLEEEEEWEARFRSVPSDRRPLKRRRLDTDVSDTENANVFGEDEEESAAGRARARGKRVGRSLHAAMDDETLDRILCVKEGDPVETGIGVVRAVTIKGVLKRVLHYYGINWPSDRKNDFVERLAADGYFAEKNRVGLLGVINQIGLRRPKPRIFLLFKPDDGGSADYFSSIDPSTRRKILTFLGQFLDVGMEERLFRLEAYPFFREGFATSYLSKDEDVVTLISSSCKATGDEPPLAFMRFRREKFARELMDRGANARLTVNSAIKQAVAYAGPRWHDQNDMAISLSKWKAVAEGVKAQTEGWASLPRWHCVEPNLAREPRCEAALHRHQTMFFVDVINDAASLRRAEADNEGPFNHVYIVENKNPRLISALPSVVAFKAPESRIYAIFPHDVEDRLVSDTLELLARSPVVVRGVKSARSLFKKRGLAPRMSDLITGLISEAKGKSNETVSNFVYAHSFCPIAKDDWLSEPLSEIQERHLAAYMEMMEKAIIKIGFERFPTVN